VIADATGTIKEPVLRELKEASALMGARITGQEKGFAVVFKIGTNGEKVLARQRGGTRLFASLNSAGAFIRDLGLPKFDVDMNGHVPGRLRKARPDRAEAMRRTRTRMHQDSLFTEQ
jgi:hypothetical protein